MTPKCPFCGKNQKKEIKKWNYNKVEAARYACVCGKSFNFYMTSKGKTWTIPKPKDSKKDNS